MEDRQVGDDSESSQPEVEAKPRPDVLSMEDTAMEDLHEASSDGHAHVSSPSTKWAIKQEMLSKYTAKINYHSDAALGGVAIRALDTRDLKRSSWQSASHLALCRLKWKTDCGQIQPTWGCLKEVPDLKAVDYFVSLPRRYCLQACWTCYCSPPETLYVSWKHAQSITLCRKSFTRHQGKSQQSKRISPSKGQILNGTDNEDCTTKEIDNPHQ